MSSNPNDELLDEPVWLFPFEGMDVGSSFFIPTLKPAGMISVVHERARVAKCRIKAYPSTEDGLLGIRVWRIR